MNIEYIGKQIKGIGKLVAETNTYMQAISMDKFDMDILIVDEEHIEEYYHKFFDDEFPGLHSHRAFCRYRYWKGEKCSIIIYATRYEIIPSIRWIIYHELFHFCTHETPLLCQYFLYLDGPLAKEYGMTLEEFVSDKNYKFAMQDEVHEKMAEEIAANNMATHFVGECYDRKWWREQIRRIDSDGDSK